MISYIRLSPNMTADPADLQFVIFRLVTQTCLQNTVVGAPTELPLTPDKMQEYLQAIQIALCRSIGFGFALAKDYKRYLSTLSILPAVNYRGVQVSHTPHFLQIFMTESLNLH